MRTPARRPRRLRPGREASRRGAGTGPTRAEDAGSSGSRPRSGRRRTSTVWSSCGVRPGPALRRRSGAVPRRALVPARQRLEDALERVERHALVRLGALRRRLGARTAVRLALERALGHDVADPPRHGGEQDGGGGHRRERRQGLVAATPATSALDRPDAPRPDGSVLEVALEVVGQRGGGRVPMLRTRGDGLRPRSSPGPRGGPAPDSRSGRGRPLRTASMRLPRSLSAKAARPASSS